MVTFNRSDTDDMLSASEFGCQIGVDIRQSDNRQRDISEVRLSRQSEMCRGIDIGFNNLVKRLLRALRRDLLTIAPRLIWYIKQANEYCTSLPLGIE